jgi:hypothetical protein
MTRYFGHDFLQQLLEDSSQFGRPVIRPVRNLDELREVYRLTHECYVESGYSEAHASRLMVHYPIYDHIPETSILVAILGGKIVGSVSYTIDGPSGLTVDHDFQAECDAMRQEGKRLSVVWRLVVHKDYRYNRAIVLHLIRAVIDVAVANDVPVALFAVNPKHELVYRRMLGMDVVGRREGTGGLEKAPAVLLRGHRDEILPKMTEHHAPDQDTVTLFHLLADHRY